MATTVATGSLGLYTLYHMIETASADEWYLDITQKLLPFVGIDFTKTGFSFLLMLVIIYSGLLLGSLLPDVDSATSILGRYVPFIESIFGHRTYFHTLWVVGVLTLLSYNVNYLFIWSVSFGYLSHLIQDSFSILGINWFYPLPKRPHFGLYRVGSVSESIFYYAMLILNVGLIVQWVRILFF